MNGPVLSTGAVRSAALIELMEIILLLPTEDNHLIHGLDISTGQAVQH